MIEYERGKFQTDEVLVFEDLWVTAHLYAENNDFGSISWLNVRLIEHQSQPDDGPDYPTEAHTRPGVTTKDPRADCDLIGDGFIKWDGCAEWSIDHHCCGVRNFLHVMTAILRVYRWASEQGFEEVDPESAIEAQIGGNGHG